MKDIAPELLEKIKKDFEKKLKKSETIKAFREKVKKKTATYKDANTSGCVSKQFIKRNITGWQNVLQYR